MPGLGRNWGMKTNQKGGSSPPINAHHVDAVPNCKGGHGGWYDKPSPGRCRGQLLCYKPNPTTHLREQRLLLLRHGVSRRDQRPMIDSSGERALLKVAAIVSPLLGSGLAPLPPQLRLLFPPKATGSAASV